MVLKECESAGRDKAGVRGYNIIFIILYLINICSLSLFIPTPCLSSAPCLSPLSICPLLTVYHVSLGVCLSLPWWKSK